MSLFTLGLTLFVILFFGIAGLSQLKRIPLSLWQHPAVFALSFTGVSGILIYFGSIELVGRYGVSGLIGLFAFVGLFIFSPLFLDPLRWISRSHAFATLPDLLVYRFRNPATARASSLLLATATLPIAAAQLDIFINLIATTGSALQPAWLMAAMTAMAVAFIRLWGHPEKAVRAIPGVAAIASLLALAAVLCTGAIAVHRGFGGFEAINAWAERSAQNDIIMRFDAAYALILLFFPMAFLLPHQGYMFTLSNWWPKNLPSGWMIPFVILLATLPIFPVLWAGLNMSLDSPLEQYYLSLPLALDAPWLAVLTTVAMLFIALSLLIACALAIGKILVTTFVTVNDHTPEDKDIDRLIERRRFLCGTLWLVAAFIFSLLCKSNSISDMTIAGMMGVIQLLPGLIATLYVPKINHKGFLAGLLVGTGFWFYGVAAPLTLNTSPPSMFGMQIATGAENWPFWLLESLVANLLTTLFVSLTTRMTEEEKQHAFQCMVDNLPTPQRQGLEVSGIDEIGAKLTRWLGRSAAERTIAEAVATLNITEFDQRPMTMRILRDQLSFQLSARLGTLAAEKIMDRVMPFGGGSTVDDISLVESQLATAGNALSGLAAELNKLRLYHRQTLENLPIGVCSVDSEGEVLLWNNAITRYTGIGAMTAEGGNLKDIPPPWGDMLERFYRDARMNWPAHEVRDTNGEVYCFDLTKHRVEDSSPLYSGYQVILMEDITERIKLVKELAHAERLTSVGRLAAGVAHEIGNPVTGISCLAQDMMAESSDQVSRRDAGVILDLTDRITSIVRTLIDFSRSDSKEELKPVSLKGAIDSAIQLLELDKSAKVVEFRSTISQDLRVRGDIHQLTQVFVNLLANARDASHVGDSIEIEQVADGSDQVVIHVTDFGCGIPPELQSRVMEPFFTTKDPGEGTGLGLSLVFSIMRYHKGTVEITSPARDGKGTRVTLTFSAPQNTAPLPLNSQHSSGQ